MEKNELMAGLGALQVLLDAASGKANEPKANKSFKFTDAKVEHNGKKIILPSDPGKMSYAEARDWLTRLEKAEAEVIAVHEVIQDAHPWDGAVAFMRAMKDTYGWASPTPTPGFFGPQPPTMVSIETAFGETATIFWGAFKIPGIENGMLVCNVDESTGRPLFMIGGQVQRKYLEAVHELAELTRRYVREQSIYRGKALRLTVKNGTLDYNQPPKFMNLSKVNEEELVFSDALLEQVNTNLWTPIEHTENCRQHKVPLKRGVLLEGPYGTGKTLTATVTAKKCESNGWTFVTIPRVTALEQALHFASNYQPCVVFVEDIDREMTGERTASMDDILNTIDGIISKGTEIMVVLTSNHANDINRAMLRPGRLDAILHIGAPDAKAAEKLIRVYGRTLVAEDADLTEAGKELDGRIPAVIRECVERAKLYSIGARPDEPFTLTGSDIARAARGMAHHLSLLEGPKEKPQTPAEKLAEGLVDLLNHKLGNGSEEGLSKRIKDIGEQVSEIHKNTV